MSPEQHSAAQLQQAREIAVEQRQHLRALGVDCGPLPWEPLPAAEDLQAGERVRELSAVGTPTGRTGTVKRSPACGTLLVRLDPPPGGWDERYGQPIKLVGCFTRPPRKHWRRLEVA